MILNIYDEKRNIIYELINGNGTIKEYYDNDKLEFEGQYLNCLKNGNIKEYDYYNNLIFEGEYLNGKRNGKCKEYDKDGKLIFEGEYLVGKRWNGIGKGKGNFLSFEGEYLNGEKWNGKGKEYIYCSHGRPYYEIEFKKGKMTRIGEKKWSE